MTPTIRLSQPGFLDLLVNECIFKKFQVIFTFVLARYHLAGTELVSEMEKAYKIAQMNILAPKIAQERVFHDIFQFAPKKPKIP